MTCRECQDLMLEVARDRAAPFVRQTVLAHTEFCSACGTCLDRERALTAGLRSVALEGASSSPSADLESGLLKAFESHHGDRGSMQSMDAPATRTLPRRWLPVAAAVALCAAGLTWWLTRSKDVPAPPPVIAAVQKLAQPIQVPAPPTPGSRRRASGSDGRRAQRAPGASRIPAGCQTPDSAGWLRSHPIGCRPAGVRERPDRAARNSCDGSSELRRRNTSRQRLGDSGGSARRTGRSASSDSARECKCPGLTPSTVKSGFKQLRAPAMERIGRCERL